MKQPPGIVKATVPDLLQGNAGKAATKASAYGGSEAGAAIGHMVGPPVIGGIVGNLVGERVGEGVAKEMGLDKVARNFNDDVAGVVGQRRADKMSEIAMTALGYSESERCVCCPCMPKSQILFFVMVGFFVFNCYRIGVGIDFDLSCSSEAKNVTTITVEPGDELYNSTELDDYWYLRTDAAANATTYLVSYPCEFAFEYLLAGAAVWLAFLPFYIFTLLGNCWRQCCCCLCDPLVRFIETNRIL